MLRMIDTFFIISGMISSRIFLSIFSVSWLRSNWIYIRFNCLPKLPSSLRSDSLVSNSGYSHRRLECICNTMAITTKARWLTCVSACVTASSNHENLRGSKHSIKLSRMAPVSKHKSFAGSNSEFRYILASTSSSALQLLFPHVVRNRYWAVSSCRCNAPSKLCLLSGISWQTAISSGKDSSTFSQEDIP